MSLSIGNPHNLARGRIHSRSWCGVTMHSINQYVNPGPAWHEMSSDFPILSIVLEEEGGQCETRSKIHLSNKLPARSRASGGHISIVPAGYPVWGYSDGISRVHEARLILDPTRVRETIGEEFREDLLTTPALMLVDAKLQSLARLLAAECSSDWSSTLYGDGLMSAMLARLASLERSAGPRSHRSGLPPRQLAAVKEFVAENLADNLRLADLANVVGLSQSQFLRAFKASTGTSPHQWHLTERLALAKSMLTHPRHSLVDIALATGFSEQSHFSRVFRSATGITPGAWRRNR